MELVIAVAFSFIAVVGLVGLAAHLFEKAGV